MNTKNRCENMAGRISKHLFEEVWDMKLNQLEEYEEVFGLLEERKFVRIVHG